MGALSAILRNIEGGQVSFWCPGCNEAHAVGIAAPATTIWGYNGNPDAPTFTPSVLVRGHKRIKDAEGSWSGGWERDEQGNTIPFICHSFVIDGQIQFLGDCTHTLAGQTVPLPDFEEQGS